MPSLGMLAGVRSSDTAHEEHRLRRDRPRTAFKPIHAATAVLILATMLCASLTMLVQQAIRYERVLTDAQTSSVASGSSDSSSRTGIGDGTDTSAGDDTRSDSRSSDSGFGVQNDDVDGTTTNGDDAEQSGGETSTDSSAAEPAQPVPTDDGRIDLNTATSEELQTVKGIGPVTAERILAHRKAIGRFTSVDQLLDVKGIGTKTLAKIRDEVAVR
ncbi:ComEA family DNA-binding protein [Bifidobacterium simiiventris]|uniref:ComEA family DNA-binding protein n=1 Tax=Bifidobacterium simiiventris TaxID=2834434 RepID=UPI001F3BD9CD|nr:helix-hairpin-helix domain-containing protein [Bifidobacterium simiiventris]